MKKIKLRKNWLFKSLIIGIALISILLKGCKQIDETDNNIENKYKVSGIILDKDGRAFEGGIVKAYDIGFRTEELLGKNKTDNKGYYVVNYEKINLSNQQKETANLKIKVFTLTGEKLEESTIIFNSKKEEIIDLRISKKEEHEYRRIVKAMGNILTTVPVLSMTETSTQQDISILAGITGFRYEQIKILIESLILFDKLNKGHQNNVPTEIIYGLLRAYTPQEGYPLMNQSKETLATILKRACEMNIIEPKLTTVADSYAKLFKERADEEL